ncbi:MAG: hypothetical protein JOZ29_08880 [Deltaproteobacteria bacterium]|nr:hypothetical protein [Deltaproteobacteria bacterium]
MNHLNGAGPAHNGSRAAGWVHHVSQQIQALDYELHASLRILANGEMDSEHMTAFMGAVAQRDRMMARVVSYIAELRNRRAIDRQECVSIVLPQRVAAMQENERLPQDGDPDVHDGNAQIFIEFPGPQSRHSTFRRRHRLN